MTFDSEEDSECSHKNPHLINDIPSNTFITSCFGIGRKRIHASSHSSESHFISGNGSSNFDSIFD